MNLVVTVLTVIFAGTLSNAVPSPEISVSYTSETIEVSWTPVNTSGVEDCFVLYHFIHQVNGVNQTARTLERTSYSVPYTSCADNVFFVSTRCRTGAVVASATSKNYFTRLHEDKYVQDLTATHIDDILEASWSRPPNSEACDINYYVNVRTSDGRELSGETSETKHNLGRIELPPCGKYVLTVTPFDSDNFGMSKTTTLIADPGSAGGIENLVVNNNRIEWEESQDNGECEITYSVVVRDGDESITTYTTTNTHFEIDWIPCSVNNIAVSSRMENIAISTLYAIHRPRPEEVGKIDEITLQFENGILSASWLPLVIGICEVNYKLQHLVNGVLMDSALILETEHVFSAQYCSDNTVIVLGSVDSVIGEETTSTLVIGTTEPGPVIPTVSDSIISIDVSWNTVAVGFCEIRYLVEHFVNEDLIFSETVDSRTISVERISCSDNEIRVTPIAAGLGGEGTSAFIKISVESIDSIENIEVLNTGEGLLVSWNPIVEGLCEIVYSITNFNGETTTEYATDMNYYVVTRTDCVENEISVQGVELSTGITSEITTKVVDVDIEMSMVRNLGARRYTDGLIINWEPPVNSEQCILSYLGYLIAANGETTQFETTSTSYALDGVDIESCSQYMLLLAPQSVSGASGIHMALEDTWYLTGIDSVQNLKSTDFILIWDRPANSGVCELTYKVEVAFKQDSSTSITNVTSQQINMIPCVPYEFSVIAIDEITNLNSDPTSSSSTGSPRILEGPSNIDYSLELETLTVAWNPADAGTCNLYYNVAQKIDSKIVNVITTNDTTYSFPTKSCTTNDIIITPVIRDWDIEVSGEDVHVQILVDLDELGSVQDISVAQRTLSWNAPEYSGVCSLTYLIEILDKDEIIKSFKTEETAAEVGFIACYTYTVRITPIYGDRVGIASEMTFTAGAAPHKAPAHVQTIPSLASAAVTFQANPTTENYCPISEVLISCTAASTDEVVDLTIPVEDDESRIFQVLITPLIFNTHYSCVAKWLPHESEFSEAFYFYTMDIPVKELNITDVTSNEITISWDEKEALLRYVTIYVVVITSIEPLHFVQESCNLERGYTRFIEVPGNEFTFTFREALPNFRYHISLITRYNIGYNSHAEIRVVTTLPSIPGVITDLTPQFKQEECEKYSAEGIFIWSPPCDINGDLDRFEIEITTYYEVNGEYLSAPQKRQLTVSDADDDYKFSVDIPSVNPLFKYSISINVFAAYPGEESSKLTYITPPPAFAYCSS